MSLVPHKIHHMMFVFVLLLLCMTVVTRSCNDKERQTLLGFKATLVDINNNLYNWGDNETNDCCQWVGVTCNDQTGHVTEIDLSTSSIGLSGNTSSLLLPLLSQLQYLDLSGIDFQLSFIPNSFSSLTNLQYLKISSANLSGSIPDQLAKLSNLLYLDVSKNSLGGLIPVSFGDLTSLTHLDLSRNQLEGVIPKSFGNWSSLELLDLSKNFLNGSVPNFVGCSFTNESIFMSHGNSAYNRQQAPGFTGCPSLQKLDLSENGLTGNLPDSVGKLLNLQYLDVSSNSLEGLISDVHVLNLTLLTYLDLSFNSFTVNLSSHTSFGILNTIKLKSCNLGPSFPKWIQTQRDFAYLDISNAGISDRIPSWFWDLPPGLKLLNLSSNEIKGRLPNMTSLFQRYPGMDLSYNQLEGTVPVLPSKLAALNLAGNRFSGTLSFVCQIDATLSFLDLSNNLLSGSIPDCLQKFKETLVVLNLSNNSLSGEIPSSLGFLSRLQALYLRRNAFVGEIPKSLMNCTKLRFMDLGENKLSGNIPTWIGEKLSELYVLVLRSNKLDGILPSQICLLGNLQLLDLSKNGLSGNVPTCVGNFTAMATRRSEDDITSHSYYSYVSTFPGTNSLYNYTASAYRRNNVVCSGRGIRNFDCGRNEETFFIDNAQVAWKGTRREFGRGLYLLKSIDVSSNKLYGKLPDEITNLRELVSLNFSINKLQGLIPRHIGQLGLLQSLDLSRNELSGNIPSSLSQLTFLSYLDVAYNNLSGRIPLGPQLQLFDPSSYAGNPQLCGAPLTQRCGFPLPPAASEDVEDGDELWISYYTGIGTGFAAGFCGICGALILNSRCRYLFFASLNKMNDWIYVTTIVHFRILCTKFRR